jgi:predicted Zn-dependent protease
MPRTPANTRRSLALAAGAALVASPLAAQAVRTISQSDKAEGAKANPELIAEFGGALGGPQASYVASVGKTIALQSGLGNARDDFTVTLLNSPVNNAFAIPGGYVYVTRQLVGLMNNEAELAGVLGHEVGHVAARHSAKRQKAATRNSILGVLGAVLGSAVGGGFGNLLSQGAQYGAQIVTLKYSRGQETEADNLAIQYLRGAGYDPRAMGAVLQSLATQTALDARLMGQSTRQTPAWASTHPDPASRVRAALAKAGANAAGATNRDIFLSRIDGLMYGDDPHQGAIEGRTFVHPDYRLAFDAPNGFLLNNSARKVSISGQSGQGELSTGPYRGNLDSYVRSVFAGLGQGSTSIPLDEVRRTTINGIPAAFAQARVNSGGSLVDVVVFAYDFGGDQAFHFLTITAAGQSGVFDPLFRSMRRISANEAASIRPRRIVIHTVRPGDTLQSLSGRMAYPNARLERFLVLNGLGANASPMPGEKVKLVVY